MNICIAYVLNLWSYIQSVDFTLKNSLFGTAELTKDIDFDKYFYSEYGIGIDARRSFSLSDDSG